MRTLRRLIVLTLLLSAAACSGAKKTEPPLPGQTVKEENSEINLRLSLEDTEGNPVPGVKITAVSGSSTLTAITGNDGKVGIAFREVNKSGIDFSFSGADINWSESVREIPPGITPVSLYFVVNPLGKVRFSRLHY